MSLLRNLPGMFWSKFYPGFPFRNLLWMNQVWLVFWGSGPPLLPSLAPRIHPSNKTSTLDPLELMDSARSSLTASGYLGHLGRRSYRRCYNTRLDSSVVLLWSQWFSFRIRRHHLAKCYRVRLAIRRVWWRISICIWIALPGHRIMAYGRNVRRLFSRLPHW